MTDLLNIRDEVVNQLLTEMQRPWMQCQPDIEVDVNPVDTEALYADLCRNHEDGHFSDEDFAIHAESLEEQLSRFLCYIDVREPRVFWNWCDQLSQFVGRALKIKEYAIDRVLTIQMLPRRRRQAILQLTYSSPAQLDALLVALRLSLEVFPV